MFSEYAGHMSRRDVKRESEAGKCVPLLVDVARAFRGNVNIWHRVFAHFMCLDLIKVGVDLYKSGSTKKFAHLT